MEIRLISAEELPLALALVEETYREYVLPCYDKAVSFPEYLGQTPEELTEEIRRGELRIWMAFSLEEPMGMAALKGENHIRLFYVHRDHQRQGVGKALMETLLAHTKGPVTVNASPYALSIYERMGFVPTDEQQDRGGVLFTPMRLDR